MPVPAYRNGEPKPKPKPTQLRNPCLRFRIRSRESEGERGNYFPFAFFASRISFFTFSAICAGTGRYSRGSME